MYWYVAQKRGRLSVAGIEITSSCIVFYLVTSHLPVLCEVTSPGSCVGCLEMLLGVHLFRSNGGLPHPEV